MFFILSLLLLHSYAGYVTPEQLHLSWTENPNEMRLTWVTFFPIECSIFYRSLLCSENSSWKKEESSYEEFQTATYFYRLQYIHTGVLKIQENCNYEYYVGSLMGQSEIYTFHGRTHSSNDKSKTNLIIVADWGGGATSINTKNVIIEQLIVDRFEAILHIGDMAYDLDDLEGMVGDAWLNMIQPLAARVPYMTLPGNHEPNLNYTQYRNRFKMPINEANEGTGWFYSFNFGKAHYVMLNTEILLSNSRENEELTEINWFKQDLNNANANRHEIPWIIVLTHRNLYCSVDWTTSRTKNKDCSENSRTLQNKLEDTMYEAGVDLFMQAHVHNYERNTPIYKNATVKSEYDDQYMHFNPRAPIYITNGNAGNIEGHNDPISRHPQLWSMYSSEEYGYGNLKVYNSTHLY